jgi:hypothetical protein
MSAPGEGRSVVATSGLHSLVNRQNVLNIMNAATDDKISSNSALRQGLLKRRQATDREKLGAFVIGCALLAFGYWVVIGTVSKQPQAMIGEKSP